VGYIVSIHVEPEGEPVCTDPTEESVLTERSFMPFARPSISEDQIDAVAEVLRSGWITTGPKTAQFEKSFADYVGAPHAVALSSGTAGAHVLLRALGIGPGDEVITPSMTWVSTANMIVLAGATPVWVDVDPDTLLVTAEAIEEKITERTRLIIPLHYAGAAADRDAIGEVAERRGIPFVEDAAHAVGTEYKGVRIGTHGTTIYSFHPVKNLTTGEGGMFCTDDSELAEHVRRLIFHGLGRDEVDSSQQGRAPHVEVIEPGYKYNMTDMAAVLGLGQLGRLDGWIEQRTQLAGHYRKRLEEVDEIRPLADPAYPQKHSWHLFVIRVESESVDRNRLLEGLKARDIGAGIHFKAVHLQKYYRESSGQGRGLLPHTERASDRICSLPLDPGLGFEHIDYVVDCIKDVIQAGRRK